MRPSGAVPLASLTPGSSARVVDVAGRGAFRRRLLDMGFIQGAPVQVIRDAPLGNPVEYCIGGTHVTLRKHEAMHVLVAGTSAPMALRRGFRGRLGRRLRKGPGHRRRAKQERPKQ